MKIFLFLIILMTSNAFAISNSAVVECRARISKVGYFGVDFVSRDLRKNLVLKKNYADPMTRTVEMQETVIFDLEYSVSISYKEIMNLKTGNMDTVLNGKIYRHRVGNGKILIGENSRIISTGSPHIGGYINLNIANKFNNLIGFQNQGVVKDAFIECSTL